MNCVMAIKKYSKDLLKILVYIAIPISKILM